MVAQAIVALQRRAYVAEAELVDFPGLPPLTVSPADIMNSVETFYGVAVRSGLAALVAIERDGQTTVVSRLCVAPDHTRRGHATRLLRRVMEDSHGDLVVTTAAANRPALALYGKLGFVVSGKASSPEGLGLVTLRLSRDRSAGHGSGSP